MGFNGEGIPTCTIHAAVPDELELQQTRGAATDAFYGDLVEPSRMTEVLIEKGYPQQSCEAAVTCLFNIIRNTCRTAGAVRDPSNPGSRRLIKK